MRKIECEACASGGLQSFCTCENTKCTFCKVHRKCRVCGELICLMYETYYDFDVHLKCAKEEKKK